MSDVSKEERSRLRKLRSKRKVQAQHRKVWKGEDDSYARRLSTGFKMMGGAR